MLHVSHYTLYVKSTEKGALAGWGLLPRDQMRRIVLELQFSRALLFELLGAAFLHVVL